MAVMDATPAAPAAPAAKPAPRPPRPSVTAAAPMVGEAAPAAAPAAAKGPRPSVSMRLPAEFAGSEYKAAEQRLGQLLQQLLTTATPNLHLRVPHPPSFPPHRQKPLPP